MKTVMKTIKFIALCVTFATINLTCSDNVNCDTLNKSLQAQCRPTRHSYIAQERFEKTTYHIGGIEVSEEEFYKGRQHPKPSQSETITANRLPEKQTQSEITQSNRYGNRKALEEVCVENHYSSYLDIDSDSDSDDEIEPLSEEESRKLTEELHNWFAQRINNG